MDSNYSVGEPIIITKKELLNQKGTILYVGPLEGKEEIYYGIRLENPLGSHDGKYKDKQYFTCEDKHGVFILDKYLQKPGQQAPAPSKKDEPKKEESKNIDKKKPVTNQAPVISKKEDPKTTAQGPSQKTLPKDKLKKEESKVAPPSKITKPEVKPEVKHEVKPEVKAQVKTEIIPEVKQEVKADTKKMQSTKDEEISIKLQQSLQDTQSELTQSSLIESSPPLHDYSEEFNKKINELQIELVGKQKEIESLNYSVETVTSELDNLKQSQTALQAVNNDLKGQIQTLRRKNDQLEIQLKQQNEKAGDEEIEELTSLVETLTMENENLKAKLETQKKTLDEQAVDIKRLQEEKELAELELEEAILTAGSNFEVQEGHANEANQELVIQNGKLRQALQVVSDKLDNERIQFEFQLAQTQQKLDQLPALNEKVKLLEKLQEKLKKKDEEIEELSQRLDDTSSLSEMVEKLADTMLKKDEDIQNQKRSLKEMNELKKVNEELIADLEEYVKEQTGQLKDLEFEVYELKRARSREQQDADEKEQVMQRLKQKIGQLNKQLELLKDEQPVQQEVEEGSPSGTKVQDLLNKYHEVVQQRRDMYKRYLNLQIENSDIRNEVLLKGVLLIRSIPQEYQSKLLFHLIDPLSVVRRVGEKAHLLTEELLQNIDTHGEQLIKEENQDLGFWMTEAAKHLGTLNNLSLTVSSIIENLGNQQQLEKIARNGILINQFKMAGSQVDEIINLVAEDKLSPKESISGLQVIISHIQEDLNNILQTHNEFKQSSEYDGVQVRSLLQEMVQTLTNAIFSGKLMREQELQRKVGKDAFKLDQLVETVHKRAKEHIKIINSYRLSWGTFEVFRGKNSKLYEQLKTYLQEFLQIIEKHLSYETQDAFLTGKTSEESILNEQYYLNFRDKCISIAHVLNTLNQNLGSQGQNVQDLVDEFSISHRNTQSNQHIYNPQSVWGQISHDMHQQLEKITFTIESEKRLKEELETTLQDKIKQQNDIQNLKKAREALERRIVDLQMKADRVAFLENEKKRLLEKQQSFTEATELTRRELENYETKYKELEEEKSSLEQMLAMYQSKKTDQNSNLEQFIGKQNPRLQSKLMKMIDQNKAEQFSQPTFSVQNLDDVKGGFQVSVTTGLNKTLWKEIQEVKETELRSSIYEITQDLDQQKKQKKEILEAVTSIKKLRHEQLKQMAGKKIISLKQPREEQGTNDLKFEIIRTYAQAMKAIDLNVSKQNYDTELLKQIQEPRSSVWQVDKATFLNSIYQVIG